MSQPPTTPAKTISTRPNWWWSHPRQLFRYVFSLDDTPHHVALGAAVGMFVGLTPTPGVQMLLVLAVHYLSRRFFAFSLPAGLAATYASNPLTALPLAWVSYQTGRLFVGGDLSKAELAALMGRGGSGDWWRTAVEVVSELGKAYLIGSVVVAAAAAVATYVVMLYLIPIVRGAGSTVEAAPRPGRRELVGAADDRR